MRKEEAKATKKYIRILFFRAFLLTGLITGYLYLPYGGEPGDRVLIQSNVAWNSYKEYRIHLGS